MVIIKGELVKSLYMLAGSTLTCQGGAVSRKKEKSIEVELDGKSEDGATNICKEESNSKLQVQKIMEGTPR